MPHPMTDKEAELLRDLEIAAAEVRRAGEADEHAGAAYRALWLALDAISAYRAQPQEAEGETVEVRAVVTMTPGGKEWTVMGSEAWSDDDAERMIRDYDRRNERRVAIITARVPLPVIPTISATVVT